MPGEDSNPSKILAGFSRDGTGANGKDETTVGTENIAVLADRFPRDVSRPRDEGPQLIAGSNFGHPPADNLEVRVLDARTLIVPPPGWTPFEPFQRPDRFLRSTRQVGRIEDRREVGPARFALVHAEGAAADILLPAVTSRVAPDPLGQYALKLERSAAFPEQRNAIRSLGRLERNWAPASGPTERPRVAILVNEPEALLAGESKAVTVLVDMLRENGCEPVLVPPLADVLIGDDRAKVQRAIADMVQMFDGVIGPGGADVHPRIYREAVTYSVHPNFVRDRFESEVALAAMKSDCFLLGICRSHQLWNAARGGSLVQDVRKEGYSTVSQRQSDFGLEEDEPFVVRGSDGEVIFENRVRLEKGSQIAAVLDGAPSVVTNSYHHQAVRNPGAGLKVTGAVVDPDTGETTIEATEDWNVITTQFHPELMMNDDRFRRLTETVARRAKIFQMKKKLEAKGRFSVEALRSSMQDANANTFMPADYEWVKSAFAAGGR